LDGNFPPRRPLVHSGGIFAALSGTTAELIVEAMDGAKAPAPSLVRLELSSEALEHLRRPRAGGRGAQKDCEKRRCAGGQ